MSREIVIFLTGTIQPENVPNLKRTDPSEREQDYYVSLNKWMQLNYPVIFVESSNFDSTLIESLFSSRPDCEYIKFQGTQGRLGKSHGEAEIIKYAFEFSAILKSSAVVIKASGSQYISNSISILNYFMKKKPYIIAWLKRFLQYSDSRFFISYTEFYTNYLLKTLGEIDESNFVYLEHVLARSVHRCMADGKKWLLPNEYPICEGISGTNNVKYKNNMFTKIKGDLIIKLTHRLLRNDFL